MQIKHLILILFTTLFYLAKGKTIIPTSNWILDIKNEKGTNETIILKPNILTKIILIVRHEDNIEILDRSFDKANFVLALENDNDIKLYGNEINIIPSVSLEYIAYIGLKCDYEIKEKTFNLQFKVKQIKDLDNHDMKNAKLTIYPVKVEIDNNPSLIEIEPIETELTGKGFSLFRLKNEIFNMEKVVITLKNKENKNFVFKDVEIDAFKDRNEFGENENNHGILLNFPFGTELEYKDLKGNTNNTFNLIMKENDKCSNSFILSNSSSIFNITINENQILKLNDSVKEAIIYNIENITPKKDLTNNIQLNLTIPVAPVIINCKLNGEGRDEENDEVVYVDYIKSNGSYLLKFDNLNSNNEYKGECEFNALNFEKNSFKIKIGNDKDNDFVTPLYPSRTNYTIPQCLEFTFTSMNKEKLEEQVKKFTHLSEKLCHKIMTEDENILSRIMGSFKCNKAEFDEEFEKKKRLNRSIICIGISPSFKYQKFRESIINKNITYYEDHVNKFVELVNKNEKINSTFGDEEDLNGLELVDFKRYYDLNSPEIDKIKLVVNKEGGMKKKEKLEFNITSTNDQPIECFYNQEMRKDDKKRFMNLYHNRGKKSITLYPNEQKTFETKLNDFKDKIMFTLYMNCYNLPGAKIRYEQTGVFNAYTYLYTDNEEDQSVVIEEKTTINCAEKNNRINPHCLKGKYNELLHKMKTKMPDIDIDDEVEKFGKLSNQAQLDLLNDLEKKFNTEIEKIEKKTSQFVQKIINMAKYLSNRDCSIYSSGSTNDLSKTINNDAYKNCRESKKKVQKKLIELIKDNFKCNNLMDLISKDGLTNNVEENIKYIILLIQELSNNADSFNQGESDILYDITTCFEQNFNEYWKKVEDYMKEKNSLDITISVVKKDLSNLLIQSLVNLIKVLHFEEIDNYIKEDERNITDAGIMGHSKGKKIHKSIKDFLKHFNEFGTGEYNLSDSILINVTINEDYKESQTRNLKEENDEIDEQITNYKDKGITVILHPKYMMKLKNAYAMQVVRYDSPIMPIKTSGDKDDSTLDTFISITLYDNKGNEISIDDLPENVRPKILYNKSYHKYLKHCFFYNEKSQDLEENGIESEDDYNYKGSKFFKCTTKHLTSFTAGNYYSRSSSSGIGTFAIVMIVLGCILVLILIFVLIIILKKRNNKSNIEEINKNEGLMEMKN